MWKEEKGYDKIQKISMQKTKIIELLTDMMVMNSDLLGHISIIKGVEKEILDNYKKNGAENQ